MADVKEQRITNETARKKLFDIPNTEKYTATRQLAFIGKVLHNSEDQITTKLLTARCNHKRQNGGVLHTNKKSIGHNLCLVISGVGKTGALKTWAHFDLNDKYWRHLISGHGKSLK